MKKLSILLASISTFNSCKDDDVDKKDTASSFTYNGKRYDFAHGFYTEHEEVFEGVTSFFWKVFLTTENITYNATTQSLSGNGDGIYLFIAREENNMFIQEGANIGASAAIILGYNLVSKTYDQYSNHTGNLDVNVLQSNASGSTIEFSFEVPNQKIVTGKFIGALVKVEEI